MLPAPNALRGVAAWSVLVRGFVAIAGTRERTEPRGGSRGRLWWGGVRHQSGEERRARGRRGTRGMDAHRRVQRGRRGFRPRRSEQKRSYRGRGRVRVRRRAEVEREGEGRRESALRVCLGVRRCSRLLSRRVDCSSRGKGGEGRQERQHLRRLPPRTRRCTLSRLTISARPFYHVPRPEPHWQCPHTHATQLSHSPCPARQLLLPCSWQTSTSSSHQARSLRSP